MSLRTVSPVNEGWWFRQKDDPSSGFLPVAQFPTNVHLDLLFHGLIPNPVIGTNENLVQWVGEKSWEYRTTFKSPTADSRKVVLAFDGLDTYAIVKLNGRQILKTKDMFLPERVDVTDMLSNKSLNILEITFDSTYLNGKRFVEKHPNHFWGC